MAVISPRSLLNTLSMEIPSRAPEIVPSRRKGWVQSNSVRQVDSYSFVSTQYPFPLHVKDIVRRTLAWWAFGNASPRMVYAVFFGEFLGAMPRSSANRIYLAMLHTRRMLSSRQVCEY